MKIDLTLDYQTILRNEPRPVHLVATLCAPKLEAHTRPRSAAFAVVLDRSGSMAGEPLRLAREACAAVVRNLRPDDLFTLVVFDDSAQVVIPLQKPMDRHGMIAAIERIADRGSTNLMAGWLLGRDELLKAGTECDKKILVLTDGHLNQGITEPDRVEALTRSGAWMLRYAHLMNASEFTKFVVLVRDLGPFVVVLIDPESRSRRLDRNPAISRENLEWVLSGNPNAVPLFESSAFCTI